MPGTDPAAGTEADGAAGEAAWRPVTRAATYELVVERIEERILAGELRVGDRLPPERELAGMLGVSRAAVREASRALQAQGVLRMAVGTGPDSGTTVAALPRHALQRFLRLHVALANFPPADVVEARVMLERHSARLAAEHATAPHADALERIAGAMDDPAVGRDRFNELDTEFHVALAEAGGNRLVAEMTSAVRESLRQPLRAAFHRLGDDWDRVRVQLCADHHGLVDAVRADDGELAQQRVESHIRWFYRQLPTSTDLVR
ncbi:FCD domain-containing protein [Salinifilum aidingensis]